MPALVTPYTPSDGDVLDPDQWNDNIYDPSVAARGILSKPNGGLDADNLAGGFLVQAEHVQPGELWRAKLAHSLEPIDYYDNGIAVDNEVDATSPATFVPVFGAACRIYVPYRSLVLWQWSLFLHPFRVLFDDIRGGTGNRWLNGFIVVNIGGDIVTHTRRRLTFSVNMQNTGLSDIYTVFDRREDLACQHYGMHHAELVTTAGYRGMSVRLFLERSDEVIELRRSFPEGNNEHDHQIHTRASFGVRSCWAIGYHYPA